MTTMKTIAFVKSDKPFEQRIAILPEDLIDVLGKGQIFIEKDYGINFCIKDEEYKKLGVHVVSREVALLQDIICDPKIGESKYLENLEEHTILFGWIHAVENKDLTSLLVRKKLTCYAWEDMFEDHRHTFHNNNYLAGESAVLHAIQCHGILPLNTKVAIIGRGNTAMGANHIMVSLGANVTFYNRQMEELLRKQISQYDIVINAVLWDTGRNDHILYHKDLLHMKQDALLIDISDDVNGAIEDARSTAFDQPIYHMDGICIYAVNNTPSILYKTATKGISSAISKYLDGLICGDTNELINCKIISDGIVYDHKIKEHQNI